MQLLSLENNGFNELLSRVFKKCKYKHMLN